MTFLSKGFLFALLAAALWGVVYALQHVALDKISPLRYMYYTGVLNVLVIAPILWFKGEKIFGLPSADLRTTGLIVLTVMLSMVVHFAILSSIQLLGASTAAILEVSYPLFTALTLFIFLGERLDSKFIVGSALILIGVYIVSTRGHTATEPVAENQLSAEIHAVLHTAPLRTATVNNLVLAKELEVALVKESIQDEVVITSTSNL